MPVTMIGRNERLGPGVSNPIISFSQPHWKIAVIMPKVAPIVSKNPAVALIGMITDRNTTSSTRSDSTTMMVM